MVLHPFSGLIALLPLDGEPVGEAVVEADSIDVECGWLIRKREGSICFNSEVIAVLLHKVVMVLADVGYVVDLSTCHRIGQAAVLRDPIAVDGAVDGAADVEKCALSGNLPDHPTLEDGFMIGSRRGGGELLRRGVGVG